jgi:hypothetical protein
VSSLLAIGLVLFAAGVIAHLAELRACLAIVRLTENDALRISRNEAWVSTRLFSRNEKLRALAATHGSVHLRSLAVRSLRLTVWSRILICTGLALAASWSIPVIFFALAHAKVVHRLFRCRNLTMRSSGLRGESIVFPDGLSARSRLTRR